MLTVSDSSAKYEHFVVTFEADDDAVTVVLAVVVAVVARELIFVVGPILAFVGVVATGVAVVSGTP